MLEHDNGTTGGGFVFGGDGGSNEPANGGLDLITSAPDFGTGGNDDSSGGGSPTGTGKRRGPKPGSKRAPGRPRSQSGATSVEALTRLLVIVHMGLAAATKAPEWELEQDDAKALGTATANVMQEFGVKPDPKVEAVVGLVVVAASIYGPKMYLIRERVKQEHAIKRANEPANVVEFTPTQSYNPNQ